MCGVAGSLRFDGATPDRASLVKMSSAQAHRGPDGVGHAVLGPCGLSHRRLAIIDLSEQGHQPMGTADKQLWVTFNGEIYNYVELREELRAHGHVFRSQTDTEVILHAYRQWGLDAFARFNGMWGLGLYDCAKRTLILSRDRLGIKPLFYAVDQRRLIFASEVKGLLAAEPELAEADPTSISRFLIKPALGYGRRTFFKKIEALDPASLLIFDSDGGRKARRYWSYTPPLTRPEVDRREGTDRFLDIFSDAVRLRFRSDVAVGTCLSGGLDSSSIVAVAAEKHGQAPAAFSAIYRQPEYAEGEFVRAMVERHKLDGHEVFPDGRDLPDISERVTYYQEAPTAGPGVYSQWHVMRAAHGEVKVLLDGQGGDELLGGYFRYFTPYVRGLIERGLKGDLQSLLEAMRARGPIENLAGLDPVRELAGYALAKMRRKLPESVRAFERDWLTRPTDQAQTLLVTPEMAEHVAAERETWRIDRVTGDPLTDTLWDTVVRTSLPYLLHHEDRNSMAFSLESRVPFLDHRLVEYMFSLPTEFKIQSDRTKVVLRDAMQGLLPEAIRERRDKKGYPTPFGEWVRDLHGDWLNDVVLGPRAVQRGYTHQPTVKRLVREHLDGTHNHASQLYRLTTLELFLQRFCDEPFKPEPEPAWAVPSETSTQL